MADENCQWYAQRAILALLNETVKDINLKLLEELAGNMHKLYALGTADVNNQDDSIRHKQAEVL